MTAGEHATPGHATSPFPGRPPPENPTAKPFQIGTFETAGT
jgi:hypothetical protein